MFTLEEVFTTWKANQQTLRSEIARLQCAGVDEAELDKELAKLDIYPNKWHIVIVGYIADALKEHGGFEKVIVSEPYLSDRVTVSCFFKADDQPQAALCITFMLDVECHSGSALLWMDPVTKVEGYERGSVGDCAGLNQKMRPVDMATSGADWLSLLEKVVLLEWSPQLSSWRHGGYYVSNVRYTSGAVGCVSNNYPDSQWRIVCDTAGESEQKTYVSAVWAALAERALVLMQNVVKEPVCLQAG